MKHLKNFTVITLASIMMAAAINLFLVPHKVSLGGISGIGMVLSFLMHLDTGTVIFVLNIPIFILGFFHLGKKFVFYSVYSVLLTSVAMQFIPVVPISNDVLISTVFGGVISGLSVGLIIRNNGSTGGVDIISLVLTKKKDYPLGMLMVFLNSVVILMSGFLIGWEEAMYTLVESYIAGKMVDVIHTKHVKLTLTIISNKGDEVKQKLLSSVIRGITVIDGEGAYTQEKRKILYTVITRYELSEVKELIQSVDNNAFVNITESFGVMGTFRKE